MPFVDGGGVVSLEFDFMPHAYAFDVVVTAIALFAVFRLVARSSAKPRPTLARVAGATGAVLALLGAVAVGLLLSAGILQPVASLERGAYGAYAEFRPVGVGAPLTVADCRPSPFWFPQGWNGRTRKAS